MNYEKFIRGVPAKVVDKTVLASIAALVRS